jgi:hypothetical protein
MVNLGAIFSNYYLLDQLKNNTQPSKVSHNLYYNLFSPFSGGGMNASPDIKKCAQTFGKLVQLEYSYYKVQKYHNNITSGKKLRSFGQKLCPCKL